MIAELTWNTFRNHAVLEYEIPKYEGDLQHPGVYCPLSSPTVDRKIADLFRGHLRLRGVECNSQSRFAEAFHARKLVL